ncbi:TonB-dependent receptor [Bacteroides heparinolyticus]|uniref:SusC/RagA family TonB-linked outer membrane protein n=1 Tax=Prevotella heparinolytica TaxID=28113 RepID=UPI0028E9F8B3|nr:TonB-dependent receptor [Bacteroides heparinolyticus]
MKKQILLLCLMLLSLCGYAQTTTVKGVVTSASDKEPLIGATVRVKNAGTGTVTGIDGDYSIANVPADAILVFSTVGYETQEIKVGGRTVINVVLKEAAELLDEVVVIGYGAVKKSDLTSSISTVKAEQIAETTAGNVMDALQGKVSGVQVISGGGPGTQPKVLIRGVTTVNDTSPLYVVDGMPIGTSINFLNSNDIASMEVLKDASAAAIYGTRGSNGVVLITTKKGMAGKTRLNFSSSVGFQTISKPEMAGASEYEQVFKTRYTNEGRTPQWRGKDGITDAEGTDWWDEVVNKTALVQNYSFNITGGTDRLIYNLSLGYFRNDSQFDYGYWDKINTRLNVEYIFNKYVKMGFDIAPRIESWDDTPNQFGSAMSMDPTTPIYRDRSEWVDNEYNNFSRSRNNQTWNPVASISRMDAHSREYGAILNPYLQLSPVKGLTLRTQFGVDAHIRRSDSFTPQFEIDQLEKSTYSMAKRGYREWLNWNWTNTLNYMTTVAQRHNINAMLGFTAERSAYYWLDGSREGTPSNNETLHEVHAGTLNQQADGNTSYGTLLSYIGRVMYNYDNRYYLTASLRADGSSKFPKGNKYAYFPALSLAWRIIGESFMENQQVFNNLKLRLGWGRVGNQNIDNSAYLSLLDKSDAVFGIAQNRVVGSSISSVGNSQLIWETVEDYNIGLDMSFLNSRLDVTIDAYRKKSHDMLYKKKNILALGYPAWESQVTMNIGKMQATGLEVSMNWRDKITKDLSYNVGLNFSAVKNKAIKISGDGPAYAGGFNSDQIMRTEDSAEVGRFYGFVADGLFQNMTEVKSHTGENGSILQPNAKPGDIRFKDLNHDGVLDENDKTYIGNAYPDFTLGLNLRFDYLRFDFTANFYGTVGNDIFNTTKNLYSGSNGGNVYAGTLSKAWHGEGTSYDIPRLTANDNNLNYTRVSSFYVEDGSYLRCKLLQVGYTLPKKWLGGNELRISFSAQNPFTITGYSGMDPERPQLGRSVLETGIDWIAYPNPRTFLFGIDFNF